MLVAAYSPSEETPSPEIARDELELIVARVLAQHAACPSN